MSKQHVTRSGAHKIGGRASTEPCSCCGIAPDPDGKPLSVTFEHPDVIFDIAPELLDTWGGDPFLAIKNVGFFVRVLLPVALTDGFAVDFGTWLEVDAEDFRHAWQTWNFPEYADLVLEGYIANQIAPWKRFRHSLAKAVVTDLARVPILTNSTNDETNEILSKAWPHAEVLAAYGDLLRSDAPPPDQEA